MRKSVLVLLLCLLPGVVSAADFIKQSVFLSQNTVTQGDTVSIHTVVSNTNNTAFIGKLNFLDNGSLIGNVSVSLSPFQAQVYSISWSPTAGSHTISADLYDNNQLVIDETQGTFLVAAPPTTASSTGSTQTVESSQPIDAAIQTISPSAAQYLAPAFAAIDTARTQADIALTNASRWAQTRLPTGKQISSIRTQKTAQGNQTQGGSTGSASIATTLRTISFSVLLYVLTALRYIITHVGIFYPVAAIIFLYVLWRLFRGVRRPRR